MSVEEERHVDVVVEEEGPELSDRRAAVVHGRPSDHVIDDRHTAHRVIRLPRSPASKPDRN